MGKHRAQPTYEKVIKEQKGRATALMAVPPLLLTAAPMSHDEIKQSTEETSNVVVASQTYDFEPLDTTDPVNYRASERRRAYALSKTNSQDTSLRLQAIEAQRVQEKIDAELEAARIAAEKEAAEVARIEAERIEAEKIEQERLNKIEEEKAAVKIEKVEKVAVAVVDEQVETPERTDESDFDITDEVQSSEVLAIAEKYLGTPYVWGGTDPDVGLDCSGFTLLVYKQLGVNLPRVSRDQAKVGYAVSRSEAQPGDLVFFNSPVSHVAIYAGNGRIIDSRKRGTVISYGNIWEDHTQFRRVL